MVAVVPRYEYRAWAPRLDEVAGRIRDLGDPAARSESTEVYLVSPHVSHVNPKVRNGTLDVKVLLGVFDGFERWEPRLKAAFPLDDATLRDGVFPMLGLPAPTLGRTSFALEQLLAEVVDPHPGLHAVSVAKRRDSFRVADCMAELADVTVTDQRLQTVAVESSDPAALRRVSELVGLLHHANLNYPGMIRRLIGWDDEPLTGGEVAWLPR